MYVFYENISDGLILDLVHKLKNELKNKFFKYEEDLQLGVKSIISNYLAELEIFNQPIKEKQLLNKKRIDLIFSLWWDYEIWIELKNWLKSKSLRTLEFQINEYLNYIVFKYIIVIVKLKEKEQEQDVKIFYNSFKRLSKNKKIIILIV